MKKLTLTIALLCGLALPSQNLFAETPCTQAGQESLGMLFRCMSVSPRTSMLPAEDAKLMNAIQNDPRIQPAPHNMGSMSSGPTPIDGIMLQGNYHGRSFYMNPYYWGY